MHVLNFVTAAPRRPLNAPTVGQQTDTTAQITWEHPGGNVDSYIVQYEQTGRSHANNITGVMETSVLITGLQASTWYDVQVATQNENGVSSFSPSGTFITSGTSTPPPRFTPPLTFPTKPPRLTPTAGIYGLNGH